RAASERWRRRSSSYSFRLPFRPRSKRSLPWRGANGLLIDEQRVDHPAHLHELLPVAAVVREAGDLPGHSSNNLAQAHLRDHALEAGAQGSARGRTPEVLVDYLDL